MRSLDTELLQRFVDLAAERLRGDWVVIGGCVLPLLGIDHRVTLDIDVAGPKDADTEQVMILMEIAEELGLPVEAINQAGAFFLRRIEDWPEHIVEVRRGEHAALFVPDATLFLLLKIRRLTASDLSDCLEMIKLARARGEEIDVARVRSAARTLEERESTADQRRRLTSLLEAL